MRMKTASVIQTVGPDSTVVSLSTGPSAHFARGRKAPMNSVRATSSVRITCTAGTQVSLIDRRIQLSASLFTVKMTAPYSDGARFPHRTPQVLSPLLIMRIMASTAPQGLPTK